MHIVICTSEDIKGCIAANVAQQHLAARGHKLSLVISNDVPKSDGMKLCGEMAGNHEGRMWTGDLFPKLELTPSASRDVVDGAMAFRTFNELQEDGMNLIRLEQNKSINAKINLDQVKAMEDIDLIFSARFLHVFKEEIITIPKHGILNMHPGALPKWKGLWVDMRAMMYGEEHLTMTLHHVDAGVDTGKIINTADVAHQGKSLFGVRLDLGMEGMRMFLEEVDRLALEEVAELTPVEKEALRQNLQPSEEAKAEGSFYTWPTREEFECFEKRGLQLCNDKDIARVQAMFQPKMVSSAETTRMFPRNKSRSFPPRATTMQRMRGFTRKIHPGIGLVCIGLVGGGFCSTAHTYGR